MAGKSPPNGSVEAWVRFQPKWDARNLREANVLASAADAMLQKGASQDDVALEIVLRRLAALQAVEQFGDWEIAEAMAWDGESASVLSRKTMEGFIKKANQRISLKKKTKGGRSNGGGQQRSNGGHGYSQGRSNGGHGHGPNRGGAASRGGAAAP